MKKTLKKVGCTALAVCSLAVGAFSFTACTTDRPEVEMQISFNGATYTLYYELYRKYAPNTVNHFLKLVENGYYDGMCIHDYNSNGKLYTGAYTYDETSVATSGLVYKPYFDTVKTYEDFPASVWTDNTMSTPTYTLYGEFKNNDFSVEHGNFKTQEFGALTMYYTAKPVDVARVEVKKVSTGTLANKDYRYNSATSRFTITLAPTTDYNYCTFALLKNHDALQSLKEAVEEYKANYDDANSFFKTQTMKVDRDDPFVADEDLEETYSVPVLPIIIEEMKVNKY